MKKRLLLLFLPFLLFQTCTDNQEVESHSISEASTYLDYTDRDDKWSGGVRMIPIKTASGEFKVWTKRIGNNPTMKVLLLHGGPGATHEYFEACDSYFPQAEIEYYYYD